MKFLVSLLFLTIHAKNEITLDMDNLDEVLTTLEEMNNNLYESVRVSNSNRYFSTSSVGL